jgi:tetratricopeptide (TPR) repeat protein
VRGRSALAVALLLLLIAPAAARAAARDADHLLRRGDFAAALPILVREQARNPADPGARRRLAWAQLETGDLAGARTNLEAAVAADPGNAHGRYLLARVADRMGDTLQALANYDAYFAQAKEKTLRQQGALRARHLQLATARLRTLLGQVVRTESSLGARDTSANAWIVPDFSTTQAGDTARALSKGLAVVLTTDLASIPGVRVLERARIGVLRQELERARGAQSVVSPETAPRWGRLIGARRIAQGGLALDPALLRLDLSAFDVVADSLDLRSPPRSGPLQEVLRLERGLVIDLAARYGWALDEATRRRLERPATESFPAFLAFGEGLDLEDQGRVDEAIEAYRRALELDSGFALARARADALGAQGFDLGPLDALMGTGLLGAVFESDRASRSAGEVGPRPQTQSWDPRLGSATKTGSVRLSVAGTLP